MTARASAPRRMRALAIAAVLLAALCFSTTGTARALAEIDASPLAIGAARIALGGGLLGILALVARHRARAARRGSITPNAPRPLTRKDLALVATGSLGVLAYQPTFFAGTEANGVAVGTVIALGSAPLATGLLDGIIRRRPPRPAWFLATACAIGGLTLISGLLGGSATTITPAGLIASLGAGLSYAAYALASKGLLEHGWTPVAAMGSVFGWAAVASIPLVLLTGPAWIGTPDGAALTLWLGVITVTLAYLMFAWGLQRLSATTTATLTLAEPLAATLLGVLVLQETVTGTGATGLALIAIGLAVVSLPERRPTPQNAEPNDAAAQR